MDLLTWWRIRAESRTRWELETSRAIAGRRARLLVLLALALPILAVAAAETAGILPSDLPARVPILGGSKAFMPSFVTATMFFGSILVGVVAGLVTGVIGAGGGYILTPALMSFGVRGIMAVGTDQFHLFAKAMMGTAIHRRLGNVNGALAVWFVVGSFAGVTVGGHVNRAIFQYNPTLSDALINTVYVVVLGLLGVVSIVEATGRRRRAPSAGAAEELNGFAAWIQRIPLRPRISFDGHLVPGGRSISIYPVILCGLIVGVVAAIMGVGGGFLTFPMFVYGMGISTFTTVGTDILQIVFTAGYSSIFQYAVYGFIFYTLAIGMLLGSLVGVQIGALVTRVVDGPRIRLFYALTILAGFSNRLCALIRRMGDLGYLSISRGASAMIENVGIVVFFGIVIFFALWIVAVFVRNLGRIRRVRGGGAVADRRKFIMGIAGLAVFFTLLGAAALPFHGSKNAIVWADTLFNALTKRSVCYLPEGCAKAKAMEGRAVDFGVAPRDLVDPVILMRLALTNGFSASLTGDGRVRVCGDLGRLAGCALRDAEAEFGNRPAEIAARYGLSGEEAVYGWWILFDGISRRYVQEDRIREANFAKFVSSKAIEPAYNFRGIEARDIRQNIGPVAALLVVYVLYTLWYGYSILFLFEGLGICVDHKREQAPSAAGARGLRQTGEEDT